ncbi:MAG: M20/M25/M40 family metallo-hydrolase [Gemmatimonadota bacterium]|nr:M20/M25/M40 family metallo-hydrolase [Gemmatimonadota bacterium]
MVRAFHDAGLEPAAAHPTYLQTFEFPVGVELGGGNRLVLQRGSRLSTIFTPGTDFLPLAGSVSDRVVQPIVFVGYGISAPSIGHDDYAGVDVEGKIVLALRYGPEGDDPTGRYGRYLSERYKAATAVQKGARAILFVNPPATMEIDRLIAFDPDERPNTLGIVAVSVSQGLARRIVAIGGADLSRLQHEIDTTRRPRSVELDDAVLNLRVDVEPRTRTTHNVIGVVEGRDPRRSDEVVVVGAHYDGLGLGGPGSLDPVPGEIHNGADDNASGVAALLELAQYFAYPTNRPDRTVMFVSFGAEEVGMLGSAQFVADPPVPLTDVVAMVNMDVIGRLRDELKVYGVGSSASWRDVLMAANRHLDLPVRPIAEGYGPSDQAAFYLRRIPVLSFFTGVHEDYHRSSDDADRIDFEGLHAVTRLVREVVERLANDDARPRFDPRETPVPDVQEPAETTLGGRIGAVPAPVEIDAEAGVTVDYVVEGSPAARAGIEVGDRIVAVAGRPVADVYAYKRVLESMIPGRAVRFELDRGGRIVETTVRPEAVDP